jgi:hypothetical protein
VPQPIQEYLLSALALQMCSSDLECSYHRRFSVFTASIQIPGVRYTASDKGSNVCVCERERERDGERRREGGTEVGWEREREIEREVACEIQASL